MKKEDPIKFEKKFSTLKAIETVKSRINSNYITAARAVWKNARKIHLSTGFPQDQFHQFYSNFRKFKSKIHKEQSYNLCDCNE